MFEKHIKVLPESLTTYGVHTDARLRDSLYSSISVNMRMHRSQRTRCRPTVIVCNRSSTIFTVRSRCSLVWSAGYPVDNIHPLPSLSALSKHTPWYFSLNQITWCHSLGSAQIAVRRSVCECRWLSRASPAIFDSSAVACWEDQLVSVENVQWQTFSGKFSVANLQLQAQKPVASMKISKRKLSKQTDKGANYLIIYLCASVLIKIPLTY